MTSYKRILVAALGAAPGAAQLARAAEIAAAGGGEVRVQQFIDSHCVFEPDGPAAVLPGELAARKVPAARRRLDLLLARHGLGWARSAVGHGDPALLLAAALRQWQPDLVIVAAGRRHRRWVEQAAHDARLPAPAVLGIEGDSTLTRLLGALLPQAAAAAPAIDTP